MTKTECATIIMANTDQYKKSHLAKMHIAELEQLASTFASAEASAPVSETEAADPVTTPDNSAMLTQATAEVAEAAYDRHRKLVKGPRMDKDEFRTTAIRLTAARIGAETSAEDIDAVMVAVIGELLQDKIAFCPINDTERLMLATIPQLVDFSGIDSVMDGKGFLDKVAELHGVPANTSKALMVALMRKRFYQIIGKKSGQKKTTIKLQSRGVQYLTDNGLLSVV